MIAERRRKMGAYSRLGKSFFLPVKLDIFVLVVGSRSLLVWNKRECHEK